jgi:predicted ATPase/signal transduction histidine kinase/tRNA A-37 threonylcarbamoyl transferase component Bud32
MFTIPNYQILNKIYESANSLIYSGFRKRDHKPLILKILKQDYPTPEEFTHYRQEYDIIRSLANLDGVINAYSLEKHQNRLVMCLEDFGGESLDILTQKREFRLEELLTLAISITDKLGQIHQNHIIHKDINPTNIIFNPTTGVLKIIDFGIATRLSRQNPTPKNPNVLEGTLPYLSPEQTGRMNRTLDYRTDFYSLGITFYELFTHQLPFESPDAMELIHCHLAKQPVPPSQRQASPKNSAIPQAISDIIIKLLSKTAEERYQSAWGLKADLQECKARLTRGQLEPFTLAQQDISDRFQIPQKLYGRKRDIETLLAAFERVANPPHPLLTKEGVEMKPRWTEMMLVAGEAGIGKSALVKEIYKPLTMKRGYFISGKFAQFQRDIPYRAIINAFAELVQQLLTENNLHGWRKKLLAALGENSQIIIDVIPQVELIIGPAPDVSALGSTESKNRFNLVFQNFIRVFCKPEHPLVIFLDDLQWADYATLKLLKLVMTDKKTCSLFLIGAYQDNEVGPAHPLMTTLDKLSKAEVTINQIRLNPLNRKHITELLADTLRHQTLDTKTRFFDKNLVSLAKLIHRKTGGNPFFVNQFINTLYEENLLKFIPPLGTTKKFPSGTPPLNEKTILPVEKRGLEETSGRVGRNFLQWNLAQIKAMDYTDNVVDLMIGKLNKLPESTQQVLRLAACVGNNFDLNTLSVLYEKSAADTFQNLIPALKESLVLPTSELEITGDDICHQPDGYFGSRFAIRHFQFLHDRVQQAAYVLIDDEHKKTVHLQIARQLLKNTPSNKIEQHLFEIVEHFNMGLTLADNQTERHEIARLNLKAGQKAKAATAYAAAVKFLNAGLELITPPVTPPTRENLEPIQKPGHQYDKNQAFSKTCHQNCHQSEKNQVLSKPSHQTFLDQCLKGAWETEYDLTLNLYVETLEAEYLNTNYARAEQLSQVILQQAKTILDKVKVYELKIVFYATQNQMPAAIDTGLQVLEMLGISLSESPPKVLTIENLYNLPEMTAPDKLAAMRILMNLFTPVQVSNPSRLPPLTFTMLKLCIQHGNSPQAALAYVFYGILQCTGKNIELGYQFGKLALRVLERFDAKEIACKVHNFFNGFIRYWKEHASASVEALAETVQLGLETGDIEFACYAALHYGSNIFLLGKPLKSVHQEQKSYLSLIQKLKNEFSRHYATMWMQLVINLSHSKVASPKRLIGEFFNEKEMRPILQKMKNFTLLFRFYVAKAMLCYLFKDYAQAIVNASLAENYEQGALGLMHIVHNPFYYSLAILALYPTASSREKTKYLETVAANQQKMKRWANQAPMNFQHKYDLVEAEKARVLGQNWIAAELYELAITGARNNQYIQEEALAYELAGEFYLGQGMEKFAQNYLRDAHYRYQQWGAKAKVKDLEERYSQWLVEMLATTGMRDMPTIITRLSTSIRLTEALDLATVTKASQAISGEIVLDKLLAKMMKIVIENAGAERGFLIMDKDGKWVIEAEGAIDKDEVTVLQSIPIKRGETFTKGGEVFEKAGINGISVEKEGISLPTTIINYVARTHENLVLNDAQRDSLFWQDHYIITKQPKSILAHPLLNQGKLTGIFYLENNLTTGAFTPERLQLINMLSAQLAISIENASLYNNLENKVAERTQELSAALDNLKATQAQLIEAEKMAALGNLVADVAHEINTPVGIGVTAASQLDELTKEINELYKKGRMKRSDLENYFNAANQGHALVIKNLARAADLIKRFKQVAVVQPDEQRRTFSLKNHLNKIKATLQPKLKESQIQMTITCEDITLFSYPNVFSQIITNLVMNSIQHGFSAEAGEVTTEKQITIEATTTHTPDPSIEVNPPHNASLERGRGNVSPLEKGRGSVGNELILRYSDNGKGIPADIINKIFEPFFTTSRQSGSTGLGLHIVYNLVTHKLNGTIRCQSIVGTGTTFTDTFMLTKVNNSTLSTIGGS